MKITETAFQTNLNFYSTKIKMFTWILYNESSKDYFFTIYFLTAISKRKS